MSIYLDDVSVLGSTELALDIHAAYTLPFILGAFRLRHRTGNHGYRSQYLCVATVSVLFSPKSATCTVWFDAAGVGDVN
jgi:hypothetical protein